MNKDVETLECLILNEMYISDLHFSDIEKFLEIWELMDSFTKVTDFDNPILKKYIDKIRENDELKIKLRNSDAMSEEYLKFIGA